MGTAKTRAQNRWISKAYDRINLLVKQGDKAVIQAAATAAGESVNAWIVEAIRQRLERESRADGP